MTIYTAVWDQLLTTTESGTPAFVTTAGSPAQYDAAFARSAFDLQSGTYTFSASYGTSLSDVWLHFSFMSSSLNASSGTNPVVTFASAANSNAQQIRLVSVAQASNVHRLKFQKSTNGGGAWTDIASTPATFDVNSTTIYRMDIRAKPDASTGVVQLYVNEVLALTFSGDTSTQNNVMDKVIFFGMGISAGNHDYYSEIILADTSTVGYRLFSMFPNAAGAQSDFGGTFAEIDDIHQLDNTDFINTDTVGNISYFAMNDIGAGFSRYAIVATVAVAALAISPDATIADLQLGYRNVSGTSFWNSSTGFTHDSVIRFYKDLRTVSPFTSTDWSITEVNGMQLGFKAV